MTLPAAVADAALAVAAASVVAAAFAADGCFMPAFFARFFY